MDLIQVSKQLSHMLRHAPDEYGLVLDAEGYVPLPKVLEVLQRRFPSVTVAEISSLASPGLEKQRFEIQGERIRATYGHNQRVVRVEYPEAEPPEVLYHGTTRAALEQILAEGLTPRARQYVHLGETPERATTVGSRRDASPVVLKVAARRAYEAGVRFYRGADQTWLVDHVPPQFLGR